MYFGEEVDQPVQWRKREVVRVHGTQLRPVCRTIIEPLRQLNIHRINASITIPFCLVTNQIEAVAAFLDFIWWADVRCDLASGESIERLSQAIVLSPAVPAFAEIKKIASSKSQIAAQILVPLIKHGIGQPAHTVNPDILVAHGRKPRCAGGGLDKLSIKIEASSL